MAKFLTVQKMDAAQILSSPHLIASPKYPSTPGLSPSTINQLAIPWNRNIPSSTLTARAALNEDLSAITSDPAQPEITWQIVIGALAGFTPFVVAGIEFSKRIVEQRDCKVCKGSGLVLRDQKYLFRCPGCGGFLPWQSWKRFFTG